MIIAQSAIQMYSDRTAYQSDSSVEKLTVWQGNQQPETKEVDHRKGGRKIDLSKELASLKNDRVDLRHQDQIKNREVKNSDLATTDDQEMSSDFHMRLLRQLFERLTGRSFKMINPADLNGGGQASSAENSSADSTDATDAAHNSGQTSEGSSGYGLVYSYHQSHYESEKTQFSASGTILTADGQKIDMTVGLSMSREFYSEQNLEVRAGDALKDPLVINFAGTAAQLTQRDFSFDIDADGNKDQISFVGEGSGMLALDKNKDGTVNDGSELFGALSGDGFGDLAAYDSDGNDWIDENDPIFNQLRIWSKDGSGNDQLMALGKVGVGAIYLGSLETTFSVKDADNNLLGQVRSTGLALMESGLAVTVQQLDLVA
jgi:hypothetical protein